MCRRLQPGDTSASMGPLSVAQRLGDPPAKPPRGHTAMGLPNQTPKGVGEGKLPLLLLLYPASTTAHVLPCRRRVLSRWPRCSLLPLPWGTCPGRAARDQELFLMKPTWFSATVLLQAGGTRHTAVSGGSPGSCETAAGSGYVPSTAAPLISLVSGGEQQLSALQIWG